MASARSPAFTAAVRVIDRVLGDAPGQRTTALPARAARLGEILVLVVGVLNRAHRAHAIRAQITLLARIQPDDDHRSEEHTSELQSLMRISYAVFCLKKKKKQNTNNNHNSSNTPKKK